MSARTLSATEQVVRIMSAVNALADLPDVRIDVGVAVGEPEFLELAKLLDATVRGHAVIYVDTPSLGAVWLYAFDVVRSGVTIHCQGTRPATLAEIDMAGISEADAPVTPERRAAALAKLAKARGQ